MSRPAYDDPALLARAVRLGRIVAILFGVLGCAGALAVRLWPVEGLRQYSAWTVTVLFLALAIAPAVLLPTVYVAMFWRTFRRPVHALVLSRYSGDRAFATPFNPLLTGPTFVLQLVTAGLASPNSYLWTTAPEPKSVNRLVLVLFGVLAVVLAGAAVFVLFRPAYLRLTPGGLVFTTLRTRTVAWDMLAPSGPTPAEISGRSLWIQVHRSAPGFGRLSVVSPNGQPALPGYGWYSIRLPGVLVDPAFLAQLVRYYRDRPAARAGIGTAQSLAQLQDEVHALTQPPEPHPAASGRG